MKHTDEQIKRLHQKLNERDTFRNRIKDLSTQLAEVTKHEAKSAADLEAMREAFDLGNEWPPVTNPALTNAPAGNPAAMSSNSAVPPGGAQPGIMHV